MKSAVTYADVLLPLALPQRYTYAVSVDLVEMVKVGHRVIVQFGKNKFYSAIVAEIHSRKPPIEPKLIESIADEEPVVLPSQIEFWKWIAQYYLATEGEVMEQALPSGLKLNSETKIILNDSYEGEFDFLDDEAFLIVQMLKAQQELTIPKIQQALEKKSVYKSLKVLLNSGIAATAEDLKVKYKSRTETFVRLNEELNEDEKLKTAFDELSRAPKQAELLIGFLALSKKNKYIKKSDLLETTKCGNAVYNGLVEKGFLIPFKAEVSRLGTFVKDEAANITLSSDQSNAFHQIKNLFVEKQVVLLQGVTGSGKTEIYTKLIEENLAQGKQSLFLLPEIALTAQIINRLKGHFGEVLGVYHSKFNQHERVEIWNKVLKSEYKIIIAARSGIFLPFSNLGLIVVDEEHDSSYKQSDPSPRYHARDCAIYLASKFNAKVLLGSATPSVESTYNSEKGKFGFVKLAKRYEDVALPEISVVTMQRKRNQLPADDLFSDELVAAMNEQLKARKQIILFHNRRGFSNYQLCRTCNHIYKCKNCDVSLTYHKFQHKLICHYCGYQEKVVNHCVSCGVADLDIVGLGTEKIEEIVSELFPNARVSRLDLDSARGKHAHENIIAAFENKEVDILVGTQMVSKGLDFENVNLVGILKADTLLFQVGYKSAERAFQLMTQVSGRAGRKDGKGKVIIQTNQQENFVIECVMDYNFEKMYEQELAERKEFHYPPFVRMIQIKFLDKQILTVEKAALYFTNELRRANICDVLGPTTPFVARVNNYYLKDILIKSNQHTKDLHEAKRSIRKIMDQTISQKEFKSVRFSIDVDPV